MPETIANCYLPVNSILRISASSKLLCNAEMEIKEIRLLNLNLLIERHGGQAELAKALKMKPSIISNIVTGVKNMGRTIARRIDTELELGTGWMDQLQAEAPERDKIRDQLL